MKKLIIALLALAVTGEPSAQGTHTDTPLQRALRCPPPVANACNIPCSEASLR